MFTSSIAGEDSGKRFLPETKPGFSRQISKGVYLPTRHTEPELSQRTCFPGRVGDSLPFLSSSISSLVRIGICHSSQNERLNCLNLICIPLYTGCDSGDRELLVCGSPDWDRDTPIPVEEVAYHPEVLDFELNPVTGWDFRLSP